jgi:anaerobic ribonucleoside-triphosphate reductase
LGFVPDKSIADCNPDTQQITFDDGVTRQVVERYTRVMGYHRPVSAFNPGKQAEHRDRRQFREPAPPPQDQTR